MPNSDDEQGGVFGIVAFYQRKTTFSEETFTRLILQYTSSVIQEEEAGDPIPIAKSRVLQAHPDPQDKACLPWSVSAYRRGENDLPVDQGVASLISAGQVSIFNTHWPLHQGVLTVLTVKRFSRSFEGNVDGEKWSFRKTHCLMTLSLFRIAVTLESAEPDDVSGPCALEMVS